MHEDTSARTSAHWAAQVVSAAGTTLLPAEEDFSHTNLGWSGPRAALMSRPLPDGRVVGLRLADLTLLVGDEASFALEGQTLAQAMRWLEQQLGASLERPTHDMPEPAPRTFCPGSQALSHTFAQAHVALTRVVDGREPRCWPHHFDLATLITLDEAESSEEARSIGVGLSPGDGSYPQPYYYVTPWPYPEAASALPALEVGAWHTQGWTGAVLVGGHEPETVHVFLTSATAACRALLGD